jgi:SAM-dependent methyltransferase
MKEHSLLMKFFLAFGMERLAWACRRLYCPVPKSALVLEVGSGGSPYFRSNVLIDAYEETRERHWAPFVTDRPSVLGVGEALPFKDKAFDFVIASHVLEHSADPERFLLELQRVAKAGYIETPGAFMERINPYWDHRSEVTVRDGVLTIKKKPAWVVDEELVELYEHGVKALIASRIIPGNPFIFHTRFFWADRIPFKILNAEVDASWPAPTVETNTRPPFSLRARIGRIGLATARLLFSQTKRNKSLNLSELMQCPVCGSDQLGFSENEITCLGCHKTFDVSSGVPRMT